MGWVGFYFILNSAAGFSLGFATFIRSRGMSLMRSRFPLLRSVVGGRVLGTREDGRGKMSLMKRDWPDIKGRRMNGEGRRDGSSDIKLG